MKRLLLRALTFIVALTVGALLYAAPPANDNLANAQVLAGDFGALIADTTGATLEEAEDYYPGTNTVWYKWTSSAKEKMPFRFAARSLSDGEIYVELDVYTNINASAVASYDNLRWVAGGWQDFCAEPGQTYLIRLCTYSVSCYQKNKCDCYCEDSPAPGKVALRWWRNLADGEWKILAADGIVLDALGDLPEDLTSADFPAGVTEIAESVFEESDGVRFVTIPATVTKIGDYAFAYSSDLAWVDYEGDTNAIDVADTAFISTPYSRELPFKLVRGVYTNVVWSGACDTDAVATTNVREYIEGFVGICPAKLVIDEGVTDVYWGAFSGADTLTKVTFPSTLEYLEESAFVGCTALAEVVGIPKTAEVERGAFYGSLYETVRPFELITEDGWVVGFHGTCPEEVTIPEGIYGIEYGAFSLDEEYLDEYGYEDEDGEWCYSRHRLSLANLKKVTIAASVQYIDEDAFSYLPNLDEVVFVSEGCCDVDEYAFIGTPYFADPSAQPFRLIADYGISDGYWQSLYDENGCLTNSVWVAYDQPMLWMEVYGYVGTCPAKLDLTQYLTNSVGEVYVYEDAFAGADTLTELVLPSVGYVEDWAFGDCENLATVTVIGDKGEMEIGDWAFVGTPYFAAQPFRLIADYGISDGYWQRLYDEYGCWTSSIWVAYDQPKSFLEVYGYVGTCPAKLDLTQYLTNGVDVVRLDDNIFAGVDTLTELILPETEYDSYEAFRDCANLAKVTVGGEAASDKGWLTSNFQGTPWLDTVVPFELITEVYVSTNTWTEWVYKDGVNCCTPDADKKYSEITHTVITTNKNVVGYYGNVPAMLTFPEDVTAIDSYVFAGCDNITQVVVPGNVKDVGDEAFAYCDNLQNVEFQEGVEFIGFGPFYGCGDGMQVILPASAVVDPCFWYSDVFFGIVGDVAVVAPRTTSIYDRAFYDEDEDYFGRTCVEYYTLVHLDAAGGTFEGDADYRCFDDVVTGLPTPVLAGNVFREWRDEDGDFYCNGDVWGENDAQVYLTAKWAVETKFTVPGLDGEIVLGEGDDYETLLRLLADTYGAEPQPSRHGLNFLYWTVDGEELNHRSVIGPNSTLSAAFEEFNPLATNSEVAVDATSAQIYDGYILDNRGNNAGTIQVKVGKPGKTGEASVSAKVQMFGTAKISFKADPNGKWKIETGGSTKGVTLFSAKASDKIVIDISEKGIFGTYGTYDIIGSRNTSKKDAAYNNWVGKKYDVAFVTKEGSSSAFTGGYSGVTVSIANKGKVKITGMMADGAKVKASAQLLISDEGEGCVNVFVPMYAGKKGGFGFVLWIDSDYTTAYVESVSTWKSTDKKAPFTAELEVVGVAAPAPASAMTFTLEAVPTISGATVLTEFLPTAVKATFGGGKITVAKTNKIKVDKAGVPTRMGTTDNDAGLKLNYMVKDGSFKGSFTVFTLVNSRLKKVKVNVNGVFVKGEGYGTAVIKNVGSFPVILH